MVQLVVGSVKLNHCRLSSVKSQPLLIKLIGDASTRRLQWFSSLTMLHPSDRDASSDDPSRRWPFASPLHRRQRRRLWVSLVFLYNWSFSLLLFHHCHGWICYDLMEMGFSFLVSNPFMLSKFICLMFDKMPQRVEFMLNWQVQHGLKFIFV